MPSNTMSQLEGNNPMEDKGKRKIFYSPEGEQSYKMKVDPLVTKVALAAKVKRR